MLLLLVRHAHALTELENPARPLSPTGRTQAQLLAQFFASNGCFTPTQIWHSPLLRSRETADELLSRLPLAEAVVVETPGLLPEDDPKDLAARLEMHPKNLGNLALIGHEPQLSSLASLLVRGKSAPSLFKLRKAAVLALESTAEVHKKTGRERWRVCWLVAPELLSLDAVNGAPASFLRSP